MDYKCDDHGYDVEEEEEEDDDDDEARMMIHDGNN